jgi:hypothetical protein
LAKSPPSAAGTGGFCVTLKGRRFAGRQIGMLVGRRQPNDGITGPETDKTCSGSGHGDR